MKFFIFKTFYVMLLLFCIVHKNVSANEEAKFEVTVLLKYINAQKTAEVINSFDNQLVVARTKPNNQMTLTGNKEAVLKLKQRIISEVDREDKFLQ